MDIGKILEEFEPSLDNLLLILSAIQKKHPQNYLPEEALSEVARYLNVTEATIYGMASYYSMLSLKPRGKNLIRICGSPVCKLKGSEFLIDFLKEYLGCDVNETTADGIFTLETCECLGYCNHSPAMMINDELFGNLDKEKIKTIIEEYKSDSIREV